MRPYVSTPTNYVVQIAFGELRLKAGEFLVVFGLLYDLITILFGLNHAVKRRGLLAQASPFGRPGACAPDSGGNVKNGGPVCLHFCIALYGMQGMELEGLFYVTIRETTGGLAADFTRSIRTFPS